MQRHIARRGRAHAYEVIDPTTTALVVVDLLTEYVETLPSARGIVAPVNRLAAATRAAGGVVAWVRPTVTDPSPWAVDFFGPIVADAYAGWGDALWPGLDVDADADLFARKTAPSALFPGRSDLDEQLRARGIDTLLVTGTVTSVCVEATARDAGTLRYRTIVVGDACAGVDDAAHAASLRLIYRSYGDVRRVTEVEALLAPGGA